MAIGPVCNAHPASGMRWLLFLRRVLSASAEAAAGSAAVVATANPVLGPSAGAAAKTAIEQVLEEFLPAQEQALDTLLERTSTLQGLIDAVQSDVRTLRHAPSETARLHVEDAAKHPATAQDHLILARNALYEAWGSAGNSATRALVAQELSAVYALLARAAANAVEQHDAEEDSRDWLFRSYRQAKAAASDMVATVVALLRVSLLVDEPRWQALKTLADMRVELLRLRLICAEVGMPEPWPDTGAYDWSLDGGRARIDFLGRNQGPFVSLDAGVVYQVNTSEEMAALLLSPIGEWCFRLTDVPFAAPAQVFVSGNSTELGEWREQRAVPLSLDPPIRRAG